jgi:DNA-binding NtrC family response regulator
LRRYRKKIGGFDYAATQRLLSYHWPGNIRELSHAVERAVLMCQGNSIAPQDLGLSQPQTGTRLEDLSLEEMEKFLIKKALARSGGNALAAAESLGLSRSAFYRRLEKYDL